MRQTGLEPVSRVWKTLILPLNYWRYGPGGDRTRDSGVTSIDKSISTMRYQLRYWTLDPLHIRIPHVGLEPTISGFHGF